MRHWDLSIKTGLLLAELTMTAVPTSHLLGVAQLSLSNELQNRTFSTWIDAQCLGSHQIRITIENFKVRVQNTELGPTLSSCPNNENKKQQPSIAR